MERKTKETIVKQLRKMCGETGKTIKEIAAEMNVAESTLRRWLKGDCEMRLRSSIKIIKYFHCSLESLIEPEESFLNRSP